MARGIEITRAEILDAITAAQRSSEPKDANTFQELLEATGIARLALLRVLHTLKREGRLLVHQVQRTSIDGRTRPVPAYTILKRKRT